MKLKNSGTGEHCELKQERCSNEAVDNAACTMYTTIECMLTSYLSLQPRQLKQRKTIFAFEFNPL